MSFQKERFTLAEIMKILEASFDKGIEPFIKYDPTVKPQYRIIRQQSHDGTQIFTWEFLMNAMLPLFSRNSYYTPEPPISGHQPVYTIGKIRLVTVFGRVDVPAGRIWGQRERIVIPVSVEWVKS